MILLNSLPFVILLISFIPKPCEAFTQNQEWFRDLENLDSAGFTNEANGWVYKGVSCPGCIFTMPSGTICDSNQGGQNVFGGPGAPSGGSSDYFENTYSSLSTVWGRSLLLGFEIWVFTTSEVTDAASVSWSQIYAPKIGTSPFGGGSPVLIGSCSTDFTSSQGSQIKHIYKYSIKIDIGLSTSANPNPMNFGIQKRSSAPASFHSIGVRNVSIYNAANIPNSGSGNFPCTTGYRWTGTACEGCFSSLLCQTCTGPAQSQCTACKSSYYDYGNGDCRSTACSGPWKLVTGTKKCVKKCSTGFYWARNQSCVESCEDPFIKSVFDGFPACSSPCSDLTKFVYPDGTCSPACNFPLKGIIEPTLKQCKNPCEDPGLFLYPDGACADSCAPYLGQSVNNIAKYCYTICLSPAKFIYPDSTCSPTCDPPLTSLTEHSISSCLSPCTSSTEYVYQGGSCGNTCPTSFSQKTENNIQFCENPCFESKTFLYEDGTCKESCNSPRIAKDDPSAGKTCKFPCEEIDYYNNRNGKCTKTCESTSEAIDSPIPKICFSTLTEEEVKQVREVAETAESANTATSTWTMIWSVISSSDSTAAMMGPLAKMLQYIKFMDIRFPEKVLILMDALSKDSQGFSSKMMKGVLKKFPSHELPRKFKVYQASSSFFVNFWPAFFNLGIILLITGLVVIGAAKTKGTRPKIHEILKNLMEVLKWNVFLITFSGSVGDIVLYTSMEFQTVEFNSFEAVLSFLLCLGINTLAVMIVMKIIVVNSAIRKSKKETKDEEVHKKIVEQEWSRFKALFECYKDYSFYQQVFLFVFLVRLALFNAMIGYMYNYPLFQAVIAVISNILMLGYLIIKRPMKKMVSLIQQIVLELVLLPFNICVLALAIMDHHEVADLDRRKSIGNVIVYINLMVPILSLVLMAVKATAMGIDFYKSWKLAKANKVKKLASVQKDFRPNDIFNHTTEGLQLQTQTEAPCPMKSFVDHGQTLDFMDQSTFSLENHSNQMGNHIIRPVGSDFMMHNYYDHQNSNPIAMDQNFNAPDYQYDFQQQQQQAQFQMGTMQEEILGQQHFQYETTPNLRPQNHRRRINKKRRTLNHVTNGGLESIEQ